MKMLETYSERLIQTLELRKTRLPYSFMLCLVAFGAAFVLFGFLDRVWAYYLEGALVIGTAAVLFVMEACGRRIAELKMYLAEYREGDRSVVTQSVGSIEDSASGGCEVDMELADSEERSLSQGKFQEVES